jgi:hypothetical protein
VPQQWRKLCRKVVYGMYIKWQYTSFVIYCCFFLNSPSELTFWITLVHSQYVRRLVTSFSLRRHGFKAMQISLSALWLSEPTKIPIHL